MIKIANAPRDTDGKLTAYAWPGGYPVFYLLQDGETMCPACANGGNGSGAQTQDDPQWNVIAADVNYEDPDMYCTHCRALIESAYAEDR